MKNPKSFNGWLWKEVQRARSRVRRADKEENADIKKCGGQSASCDDYFYETMRAYEFLYALEGVWQTWKEMKSKS